MEKVYYYYSCKVQFSTGVESVIGVKSALSDIPTLLKIWSMSYLGIGFSVISYHPCPLHVYEFYTLKVSC